MSAKSQPPALILFPSARSRIRRARSISHSRSVMSARDRLRAEKLRGGLVIGCQVVVLEQTESTNDVIRQMAAGDWPEGLCVFAEHQTAGRGQRGNKWESAAGKGLWFSILLWPKIDIKESTRVTTWVAGEIARTLEA